MNIWKELKFFGENCGHPTFKTTLLGKVGWEKTNTGELIGVIPPELQREANKHGILIEDALFKDGAYLIRLVRPY